MVEFSAWPFLIFVFIYPDERKLFLSRMMTRRSNRNKYLLKIWHWKYLHSSFVASKSSHHEWNVTCTTLHEY